MFAKLVHTSNNLGLYYRYICSWTYNWAQPCGKAAKQNMECLGKSWKRLVNEDMIDGATVG